MADFVHLNVHSMYSMLEAPCRIKEVVQRAAALGMKALALTDRGNLFGAIEFYQEAEKAGIKPIIGCELNLLHGKKGAGSLRLLVRDHEGYINLMKLVTTAHLESSGPGAPGITLAQLREHPRGLVCLIGGARSPIAHLLAAGLEKEARALIGELQSAFTGPALYLEIQNHALPEDQGLLQATLALARACALPVVATNDVFYVDKAHAETHDILTCIRTGARIEDPDRERFKSNEYYLKSPVEMAALFPGLPEALQRSVDIADSCHLELEFGVNKYPAYPVPDGVKREDYLKERCYEGLRKRFGDQVDSRPDLTERLEFELGVIEKMGFVSYFLIVWDFIRYAKEQGIPVGPGRGSGAGSMVAYVLEITDLDPIRYGLIFERFLNPERVSPPDIDVDFCQDRRGEVIDYVRQKYGNRSVAQIVTYGTLGAKMAIRDVARVMGLSFTEASRIADLVPKDPKITLQKAMVENPEFKRMYDEDDQAHECITHALQLEGMARQTGTHAAGVVIAEGDLTQYMPLTQDDHGNVITQYSMGMLESVGMLKMDFLGLKTLTVIQNTVNFIRETTGKVLVPLDFPLDDRPTFELLNQGRNVGIFQVESPNMRKLCRQFQVESVGDIIALIALYRPGPMELIPDYIACKRGQKQVAYDHPLLEEISKETYGFLIYQEQVMKAAQLLAGYSLGDADLLRRAMGKKKKEVMDQQRAQFIEGCAAVNQIPRAKAAEIFALLEKFAGYGFNKSHSAAYGLIAYQTAYLKANFPTHFLCALLCNDIDNTDKIALFIGEAREMGIVVHPPSVNRSRVNFSIEGDAIRYGLCAIKNVGIGVSEAIVAARAKGGEFTSLLDFCTRVDYGALNRRTVEALVKCGAMDDIHPNRAGLFEQIDQAMGTASASARDKAAGQAILFDQVSDGEMQPEAREALEATPPWPEAVCLASEKELMGFYISGHPIDAYEPDLRAFRTHQAVEIDEEIDSSVVRLAGLIAAREVRVARQSKKPFARLVIEDRTGTVEAMVWAETYAQFGAKLEPGTPVVLTAQVDRRRDGEMRIAPYLIQTLEECFPAGVREVYVLFKREESVESRLEDLRRMAEAHPGTLPLCLVIPGPAGGAAVLEAGTGYHLDLRYPVLRQLRAQFGEAQVRLRVRDPEPAPRRRRWGGTHAP